MGLPSMTYQIPYAQPGGCGCQKRNPVHDCNHDDNANVPIIPLGGVEISEVIQGKTGPYCIAAPVGYDPSTGIIAPSIDLTKSEFSAGLTAFVAAVSAGDPACIAALRALCDVMPSKLTEV